ncbi:MAG: AraC family transcriptional regulator [Spirochaetes bacterium]|nr:AraC family transcriptional regulator [Spirochaetota bacterium]MBU0955156.1 AraC family transcriptional regulator [Spirochaetota bacterium]
MNPEPITVSTSVLSQMFLYLQSLKVDLDRFLLSMGLDRNHVCAPDTYLPIETYLEIQEAAAAMLNDHSFGLHMGEFAHPGSWSILGYIMMNCRNLKEAFEKSGQYQRIIGNLINSRTVFGINTVRFIYSSPQHAPVMSRHCFDSAFSSSICLARSLSGLPLKPLEVTFTYPDPPVREEYERVFQCPVIFGHQHNSLLLDSRMGSLPVRMANPALKDQFEVYAQELLLRLEGADSATGAVTRIILTQLPDEKLSLAGVARQMAVSVRTLQKRLEAEGIVFSELLREIRQHMAQKYLRENYTVEHITCLLGFSDVSVFRRSFKKWSGLTPREYRERAGSAKQPGWCASW